MELPVNLKPLFMELMQHVLQTGNQFFYVFDVAQNKYAYVSEGVQEILGFSPELWAERGLVQNEELLHPEDRENPKRPDLLKWASSFPERKRPQKQTFTWTLRLRHQQGHYIWLREWGVLQRDFKGRPIYYAGLAQDVSREIEALQKKKAQEQSMAHFIEDLPVILGLLNQDLRLEQVSHQWEDCFGQRLDLSEPPELTDYFHEVPGELMAALKRAQQGYPAEEESLWEWKKDQQDWFHWECYPRFQEGAKVKEVLLYLEKTTENRQMNNVMVRMRSAVKQARDGILILDSEGYVQFANHAWGRLHRIPAMELVAQPLDRWVETEKGDAFFPQLLTLQPQGVQIALRHFSGNPDKEKPRKSHCAITPALDEFGKTIGYILVARDKAHQAAKT